jgi:hypothetical protein
MIYKNNLLLLAMNLGLKTISTAGILDSTAVTNDETYDTGPYVARNIKKNQ